MLVCPSVYLFVCLFVSLTIPVSGVYYIGNGADNRSSLHFIDPRMSVVNHDVPVLTTPDTEPSEIYSIKVNFPQSQYFVPVLCVRLRFLLG